MTTGTDVKKEEKSKTIIDILKGEDAKRQLKMALPKHLTPDRFVRVALTIINKNPNLQKCTVTSLWACLLDLSQMGLEPDGRKAHLIPFGDQCTLVVDYKGIADLVRRSGEVSNIHADIVCENDVFDCSYGSDGKLNHFPADGNRGKVKRAYSYVKLKDGAESYEVMNIDEIEAIRMRSKTYNASTKQNSGPWKTDWNEMAKKTVFRRHSKWLPLSSERLALAFEKDYDTPSDIVIDAATTMPEIQMPKAKNLEANGTPSELDTLIGNEQVKLIVKTLENHKIEDAVWFAYLSKNYSISSTNNIKKEWMADITTWMTENSNA